LSLYYKPNTAFFTFGMVTKAEVGCAVCLDACSVHKFAFHLFKGNVKHECPTTHNRVLWHVH